jgi:hypothetical protein
VKRDDSSCMPCIPPTLLDGVQDAKSRRLGAFVSALHVQQHAVSAQAAVSYSNLTPGHRIPSLHSLPYLSRPATNAVHNAMAHSGASRSGNHQWTASPQNIYFASSCSNPYTHVCLWL